MKNRPKNRRHQTAYEAPEVEGEFLNESADTMLSVSDSMGNLTSDTTNEIDSSLLDEFNEDQGSRYATPLDTPTDATKRVGARREEETDRVTEQAYRSTEQGYIDAQARENEGQDAELSETSSQVKSGASARSERSQRALSVDVLKSKVSTAKDKVTEVAHKVQTLVEPLKDTVSQRADSLLKTSRIQGGKLDKNLREKPYLFALGALVAGIAVAQMLTPTQERR